MSVEGYKRNQLAKVNDRRKSILLLNGGILLTIILIIAVAIFVIFSGLFNGLSALLTLIGSVVLFGFTFGWLSSEVNKKSLTARERSLRYLFYAIDNLKKFTEDRTLTSNYKKSKKALKRVISVLSSWNEEFISSTDFGSKYERVLMDFSEELVLHLRKEILAKYTLDIDDAELYKLQTDLSEKFNYLEQEDYEDCLKDLKRSNAKYHGDKISIYRRIFLRIPQAKTLGKATLVLLFFFASYGVWIYFSENQFSLVEGAIFSGGAATTILVAIQLVDRLENKK